MRTLPNRLDWPGPPPVSIAITRSKRARRLSLRVSRLDGSVKMTVPHACSERMAMSFLRERQSWLQQALAGIEGPARVQAGMELPIAGQMVPLIEGPTRSARLEDGQLIVPPGRAGAAASAYLKAQARARLADRVPFYAAQLGKRAGKLTLRDTRSRWGSCTSHGDLMFSWRLAMAPTEVLDYVAAHEVAHLIEMNHSPAFWAKVEAIYPDYKPMRRWLKTDGPALHRFRFDSE